MRLKQQERLTCPLTQEISPEMLTGLGKTLSAEPSGKSPTGTEGSELRIWGSGGSAGRLVAKCSSPTGTCRKALTSPSPYGGGPGNQHPPKGPTACERRTCDLGAK